MSSNRTRKPVSPAHGLEQRRSRDLDLHVGSRLRARRKEVGITLAQLAEVCQVSIQQLLKYERGRNRISVSRLHHISIVLGVPLTWFFDGFDLPAHRRHDAPVMTPAQAPELERLVGSFLKIHDTARRAEVIGFAEKAATVPDNTRPGPAGKVASVSGQRRQPRRR